MKKTVSMALCILMLLSILAACNITIQETGAKVIDTTAAEVNNENNGEVSPNNNVEANPPPDNADPASPDKPNDSNMPPPDNQNPPDNNNQNPPDGNDNNENEPAPPDKPDDSNMSPPDNQNPPDNNNQNPPDGNNNNADNNNNVGILTQNLFQEVNSGIYHMKMKAMSGEMSEVGEIEVYCKNNMTAMIVESEGIKIRIVAKDGKGYTIMDELQMIFVSDMSLEEAADEVSIMGDDSNITSKMARAIQTNIKYVGEGSGDFHGKTYRYDEYKDTDGSQIFYYMDGSNLKGIRTVSADGEIIDVEIILFDQNVPDSVFDLPDDYIMFDENFSFNFDDSDFDWDYDWD